MCRAASEAAYAGVPAGEERPGVGLRGKPLSMLPGLQNQGHARVHPGGFPGGFSKGGRGSKQ